MFAQAKLWRLWFLIFFLNPLLIRDLSINKQTMQETLSYKFLLVWEAAGISFLFEWLDEQSDKPEGFFFKRKEGGGSYTGGLWCESVNNRYNKLMESYTISNELSSVTEYDEKRLLVVAIHSSTI